MPWPGLLIDVVSLWSTQCRPSARIALAMAVDIWDLRTWGVTEESFKVRIGVLKRHVRRPGVQDRESPNTYCANDVVVGQAWRRQGNHAGHDLQRVLHVWKRME